MDIRSTLAQAAYGSSKSNVISPEEAAPAAETAFQSFAETLKQNEQTTTEALTGNADPQALVQALAETQLAVEAAVTVRDRVVEAYQEILRMPV